MQAIISEENRSSYVQTDDGRIIAAGLSKKTATKFAAVNGLLRAGNKVLLAAKPSLASNTELGEAICYLEDQIARATFTE